MLDIQSNPGAERRQYHGDRVLLKEYDIGAAWGGGNPHYSLVLSQEAVLPLLTAKDSDLLLIGADSMTVGDFRRDILPYTKNISVLPSGTNRPRFPHYNNNTQRFSEPTRT